VLLAYPHAAAHHESVEHLARIARSQGRRRQQSLQKLQ
jgi:hypothetical protein